MYQTLVIGSMNMDLVVQVERCPERGETIFGRDFSRSPGGKGANQALAAGRLGAEVGFIGACGTDSFGDILISRLREAGVGVEDIIRVETHTGVASIMVETGGENRIIVVPGANRDLTRQQIRDFEGRIRSASQLLLQLEIPIPTVEYAIGCAAQHGTRVILDPAPAQNLDPQVLSKVDILIPNTGELRQLTGAGEKKGEKEQAGQLLDSGVGAVLVTRGDEGATLYTPSTERAYSGYGVEVVDTTGAGDAFAGGLAWALEAGISLEEAVDYACQVGAFTVTGLGAQSSPTAGELEEFVEEL